MCFDRTFPPALVVEMARRLEEGGADQLWIIEDCFFTGGISLAATALAVTEQLQVGLGILPAVARNPAITAMEVATLCGLAPGRVLPGIGHGVQAWMGQMGARTPSPLTTLEEVITVVTRLLAGERVTFDGREVRLDDVALDQPPADPPPVLAGVMGPKSLALAGRVAGGVVLAEPAAPSYVRLALDQAGHPDPFHVAVFAPLCVTPQREEAHEIMAPWVAERLDDPTAGVQALPFLGELQMLHRDRGVEGVRDMPADWWAEIGPIGTLDDAAAHLAALEAAGVHSIGLFPAPEVDVARSQVDDVLALARR
jgi:alkanesulfonate monooxygenase SsuD/methylene tetrahydromethanopterin reductase-like flavin-dependent oxidoreductase (luciferase family)